MILVRESMLLKARSTGQVGMGHYLGDGFCISAGLIRILPRNDFSIASFSHNTLLMFLQ